MVILSHSLQWLGKVGQVCPTTAKLCFQNPFSVEVMEVAYRLVKLEKGLRHF